MTSIVLERFTLPVSGFVELDFRQGFEIKISAQEAQRMVHRWVLLEVSCVMGAQSPTLVIGEQIVWRVPVVLTASHVGIVGTVGTVDVDVHTGVMNNTASCKAEIERCAQQLSARIPPYTPRSDVPTEFLAKHLKPTHPKPTNPKPTHLKPRKNQKQVELIA